MHRSVRTQHGFTLVELVIVILILGILSAVALPRFLNLGKDARNAKVQALAGSIRSAAQITRAAALVGQATGATGSVSLDGASVNTVYGYPAASAAGIVSAAGIDPTSDKVALDTSVTGTVVVMVPGGSDQTTCSVSYTEATSTTPPSIQPPATAGC